MQLGLCLSFFPLVKREIVSFFSRCGKTFLGLFFFSRENQEENHTRAIPIFNRWIPISPRHLDRTIAVDAAREDVRYDAIISRRGRGLGRRIVLGKRREGKHVCLY